MKSAVTPILICSIDTYEISKPGSELDPRRASIFDTEDPRLTEIEKFGDMILEMGAKGKKRFNELSRDTAKAVHHTSHGVVALAKNLLSTSHRYILLGLFSTDQLEKEFGKLRQGCGGTYFINARQITEKLHIKHASILLSLRQDIDELETQAGHLCSNCDYKLTEQV